MMLLKRRLNDLRPALAAVAQEVYDGWVQDEDGYCDAWGYGGICQDIAEEQADLINDVLDGVDATIFASNFEQHVFVVAADDVDAAIVDIPPSVYEIGAGYCWRKIPGVEFDPYYHIVIESVNRDDFIDEYGEWFD